MLKQRESADRAEHPQTNTDTKAGLDENYGGKNFASLVLAIDIDIDLFMVSDE